MSRQKAEAGKGVLWNNKWLHPEQVPKSSEKYTEAHGINQAWLDHV